MGWEGGTGLMVEIMKDLHEYLKRKPGIRQNVYEILIRNFEDQDAEGLLELALDFEDPRFSEAYWVVHPEHKPPDPEPEPPDPRPRSKPYAAFRKKVEREGSR